MVGDDRCRVPACDDDLLLERFIGCAMDLVRGYFKDQEALERHLRLIAEAARGCKSVWEESGCDAFQALVGGLDREVSPEKVRRWARLLEGLLRRLFVMAGQTPPDRDTVRDLLEAAGLLSGNEPGYAVVPERLARARAADQLADETLTLSILRAADYRNADAHNRWRPMDRRERFELAETVILTLLCMLKRYPPILKRLVFERATQDVSECITGTEQTLEFDWRWTFAGLKESGSTSALIDRILDRAWPEGSRLVVKGALGIGLTTLGKRLIGAALSGENRSMLLVRANIEPSPGPGTDRSGQPLGRQQDAAVTLERILGDLWPTWWLQSALREGWLGVVLDGLDRLDTADLDQFVLDFECVLATWPTLRTITIRPEILPAAAQKEARRVLGLLAGKDEIRIQSRSLPGCATATAKLERAHPGRLAFWLARGAADHVTGRPIDATRELVLRQLSGEHDRHWPYVPPVLRPAASVIALAALNRLARMLYDYRDGAHMPRLEPDEIGRAFEDAFSEMQQWSGENVNVEADGNGAVTAARLALLESGLVLSDAEQQPAWLAPLVEDAVRPDEFLESVKQRWLTLDEEDRQVIFRRPNNPL